MYYILFYSTLECLIPFISHISYKIQACGSYCCVLFRPRWLQLPLVSAAEVVEKGEAGEWWRGRWQIFHLEANAWRGSCGLHQGAARLSSAQFQEAHLLRYSLFIIHPASQLVLIMLMLQETLIFLLSIKSYVFFFFFYICLFLSTPD